MPKLHGYVEYKFVEPGWTHPKGYRVEEVTKEAMAVEYTDEQFAAFLDDAAKRQNAFAELMELDAAQCAKYGHRYESRPPNERAHGWATQCADSPLHPNRLPHEPFCVTRARIARAGTRSETRTRFVRIHIPVD